MKNLASYIAFALVPISVRCMNEPVGTRCRGTDIHTDVQDHPSFRLEALKLLSGCNIIEGNLEIVGMLPHYDISFLASVWEVTGHVIMFDVQVKNNPLTNLSLIRGEGGMNVQQENAMNVRTDVSPSLVISNCYEFTELGFNPLLEIVKGSVVIMNSPKLCYHSQFNWIEAGLLNGRSPNYRLEPSVTCKCHESCKEHNDKKYCTGPRAEQCQMSSRDSCPGCVARCWKDGKCCDVSCAVGCYGSLNTECSACKQLFWKGGCYLECPEIDTDTRDRLYVLKNKCVTECPEGYVIFGRKCEERCPMYYTPVDSVCTLCSSDNCPRVCRGNELLTMSTRKAYDMAGCTELEGNIILDNTGFVRTGDSYPLLRFHLNNMINITKITGSLYVTVDKEDFLNLTFLRNLEVIEGRTPVRGFYGLYIGNTSLELLGLNSLSEVSHGTVQIVSNRQLCFTDEMEARYLIASTGNNVKKNRDRIECGKENKVCHRLCKGGCFGPFNFQCLNCKNYRINGSCRACSPLCATCSGPGKHNCVTCTYVKLYVGNDEFTCVRKCPAWAPNTVNEFGGGFSAKICSVLNVDVVLDVSDWTPADNFNASRSTGAEDFMSQVPISPIRNNIADNTLKEKLSTGSSSMAIPLLVGLLIFILLAAVGATIFMQREAAKKKATSLEETPTEKAEESKGDDKPDEKDKLAKKKDDTKI